MTALSRLVPASLSCFCVMIFGLSGAMAQSAMPDAAPDAVLDQDRKAADQEAIPLTPGMIEDLGRRLKETERAKEHVTTEIAAPTSRPAVQVSFAPGQQTTLVFTTKGYPTAISFVDRTGAPWPIAWDTSSKPANGESGNDCSKSAGGAVQTTGFYTCIPFAGSNTITVTPMSLTPRGGLLITLKGAPKPISFLLLADRGTYDDNLTVRVNEAGPNASADPDVKAGAPDNAEPFMNAMLSGIAPASAIPQDVEGLPPDDARAWRMGHELYLRTRLNLMTPAWDSSEHGEDGYTLYAFRETPYILLSAAGRTVSAALKDSTP